MKTVNLKTLSLVLMACFALAGCQKKDDGTKVETRTQGYRNAAFAPTSGVGLSGRVTSSTYNQQAFQEAVTAFLSTDLQGNYIGQVSATGQDGTGVSFGGKVTLASGSFRQYISSGGTYGGGQINQNSSIRIEVVDSYALQGGMKPIPATYLPHAEGTVSGNTANITFGDQYGTVTLSGSFDQQNFSGTFAFRNNNDGSDWWLGDFSIPTCSFFVCN